MAAACLAGPFLPTGVGFGACWKLPTAHRLPWALRGCQRESESAAARNEKTGQAAIRFSKLDVQTCEQAASIR